MTFRSEWTPPDLVAAARAGARAEFAWALRHPGPTGPPGVLAVQVRSAAPAVVDGTIVLALPVDDDLPGLEGGATGWLAVADRRDSAGSWAPAAGQVRATVQVDLEGGWVSSSVFTQVCRKDHELDAAIGSPLRRRERWWQVPRLLVHLQPGPGGPIETGARRDGADVWVLDGAATPLGVARVDDLSASRWAWQRVGPWVRVPDLGEPVHAVATAGSVPVGVPAVLVAEVRRVAGVDGAVHDVVEVDARAGGLAGRRDLGLVGRWRAQVAAGRGARRALAAREAGGAT